MFSMPGGNVDDYVSLGYFKGYDSSIFPYYVRLEDLPKKVMWTTFFNTSYDFSKDFYEVERILVFGVTLVISSYLVFFRLWSQEFDKLLGMLTASDLMSQVLKL